MQLDGVLQLGDAEHSVWHGRTIHIGFEIGSILVMKEFDQANSDTVVAVTMRVQSWRRIEMKG